MNEKNEQLLNENTDNTEVSDFDLLNEVKQLKANSVPKEEYDKLLAEKKKIMRDFMYGNSGGSTETEETIVSIDDLRNKVLGDNVESLSNREFWQSVSDLYHTRLKDDGVNIFLPKGKKTRYDRVDLDVVTDMMDNIDKILEDCEGNDDLFTTLFNGAMS